MVLTVLVGGYQRERCKRPIGGAKHCASSGDIFSFAVYIFPCTSLAIDCELIKETLREQGTSENVYQGTSVYFLKHYWT